MSFSEQDKLRLNYHIDDQKPTTYFNLIEKVGSKGPYQQCMLFIFLLNWFVTGIILLSTIFLFRNRTFDCKAMGLLINHSDCNIYVCQLPEEQWSNYFDQQQNNFKSIATINNYLCHYSITVQLLSSCTYLGAFVGYIVLSFYSDNFGRKSGIILSWGICTVGTILVAVSLNIYMVAAGLFLSGCGSDAAINISLFFFSQTVDNKKRQKYSVLVQIFFTLGALIVTLLFYLINDWRIIWCALVALPSVINLILLKMHLQETPQFLLKLGINQSLKSLNKIGKLNLDRRSTLQQEDIENVMDVQVIEDFKKLSFTPIDFCRFKTLRGTTIACSIILFMTYAMYYGPVLIIDQIGFDIYASSAMIHISELLAFIPAFFFIQKIKRQSFGICLFLITVLATTLLVFLEKPQICDFCFESIIEIIVVLVFRFTVSLFFCIFQIYICELIPSRGRAMGVGIASAAGSLASTGSAMYLGYLRRNNINVMTVFLLFGIIALGCLTFLPETKGVALREEIQQIEQYKQSRRSQIMIHKSRLLMKKHKSQITYDRSKYSQYDKIMRSD